MKNQQIILAGDPVNGFEALGPFDDFNEAFEWATQQAEYPGHLSLGGKSWKIMDLRGAEMFAGKAMLGTKP